MIRTIDIRLNAAHPELPLPEATTYVGAPSAVFVRGVPKTCGNWAITAVYVSANFPDGSATTRAAVNSVDGVWVATIPGNATSGRTENGLVVSADGIDENGDPVTGYVLAVMDFSISTLLPVPAPGGVWYYFRLFDSQPSAPKKGDVAKVDSVLKYYDGTAWQPFADIDLSNYATKADATLTPIFDPDPTKAKWVCDPAQVEGYPAYSVAWREVGPYASAWVLSGGDGSQPDPYTAGDPDAATVSFEIPSHGITPGMPATVTATRVPVGYQLGSQADKPLASEAEAEALRVGKLDKSAVVSPSTASSASGKAADAKATGDALAGKANDSAVVKLTGDQTVAGAKTFTDGVTVNDASGFSAVDPSISAMVQFKPSGIEVYPPDSPSYMLQYPVVAGAIALYVQIGVPAFDSTKTYDAGAKVVYDNAVWNCTTQVTTAGAWSTVGSNFTKLFDLAVDSTPTTNSSNLMTSGAIKNALAAADPTNKLNSTAAAPDFSAAATYDVGNRVTYLGVLYECVVAKTTASATTPDQDIYDSTHTTNHWKVTDMTTPDATLDVTSAGALRVVGADGTLLWQQGYNLNATSSATQSNEGVNCYAFAQDAVAPVALSLPAVTSGKVGDFILDVTNPSLGSPFSATASYSVGDRVIYNGAVYTCTTAHTGAWSASDFGTNPTYAAFSASSTYAVDALAVYDGKLWKCHTAVSTAGAWTGTANWQTASFTIAELTGNSISVVVPRGMNLTDMLTIGPGYTELHFTLTAFQIGGKPTWKVMRQDVENGGAS